MRKITQAACAAFNAGADFTQGDTHVHHDSLTGGSVSRMYLHGNLIAEQYLPNHATEPRLRLTLAGWPTPTTRERLNGLCESLGHGRPFFQSKHAQYCQLPTDPEPVEISPHESVLIVPERVAA